MVNRRTLAGGGSFRQSHKDDKHKQATQELVILLSFTVSSVSPVSGGRIRKERRKEDPRCGLKIRARSSCLVLSCPVSSALAGGNETAGLAEAASSLAWFDSASETDCGLAGNTCKVESQSQRQSERRRAKRCSDGR